jgi:hypothetical protein
MLQSSQFDGVAFDPFLVPEGWVWLCQSRRRLGHACGYKLANDGHDTRAIQAYLGRNIQNTTRYTAMAPRRFREFFRE